jgi:hypothetical protein
LVSPWGFAIDFVPQVDYRIRWHRTEKSAKACLDYNPLDYGGDVDLFRVDAWHGKDYCRRTTEVAAKNTLAAAEEYFATVRSVDDLPAAFEAKRNRPYTRFGFANYPHESLAYAFVLAHCGRGHEAREWLKTYLGFNIASRLLKSERSKLLDSLRAEIAGFRTNHPVETPRHRVKKR